MSLIVALRSELLKTRRTASLYLTLAAAAFGPLITMFEMLIEGVQKNDPTKIFNLLFIEEFQVTGLLALPLFLILVCTLLPQIEYRNNTWKQVLTAPQRKASVFFSKFIVIQLLTMAFFISNLLFSFVGAVVLHVKYPSLNILNQPLNGADIGLLRANSYLVLTGMGAIQFWLGLRFKNFIIPVAIGVALYFAGTVLVMQLQQGTILYTPYTMFLYSGLPEYKPYVTGLNGYSLGYMAVFLAIGLIHFMRKRWMA